MANTHAISALYRKRARLAGEIEAAQNATAKLRGTLATVDAVIRLFSPESNPELIPAIRPVGRRCLYFKHGEVLRLCVSALRETGKPMPCRNVAEYALEAKGLNHVSPLIRNQITELVRQALVRLHVKGLVRKIISWPDIWWYLVI